MKSILRARPRRRVSPRRLVLMGSVAGVALAVLLGGPSGFRQVSLPSWSNQVQAAETRAAPRRFRRSDRQGEAGGHVGAREDGRRASRTRAPMTTRTRTRLQPGSPMEKFFRSSARFGGEPAAAAPRRDRRGLRLLHLGRRLCGDQQPRGRSCQDRHRHHRRRQDPHRQRGGHRPAQRSRADQGRRQRLPVCEVLRSGAPHRRMGGRGRQSVRARRHRDGRHRVGHRSRHRPRRRRLHPDRCADQSRQFRRPDLRHQRQGDGRQHRHLLALGRLGRHRLRHPGRDRQERDRAAQGQAAMSPADGSACKSSR